MSTRDRRAWRIVERSGIALSAVTNPWVGDLSRAVDEVLRVASIGRTAPGGPAITKAAALDDALVELLRTTARAAVAEHEAYPPTTPTT